MTPAPALTRERLPDERPSITHKFCVAGHEGYLHLGFYPDGRLGEVFVRIAKEGSVVSGLVDSWVTMVSIGLQYGIPIDVICQKFRGWRFEPSGLTENPKIERASSIVDYIVRYIELRIGLVRPGDVCPNCGATATDRVCTLCNGDNQP